MKDKFSPPAYAAGQSHLLQYMSQKAKLELVINAKKEKDDEIRVDFVIKKDGDARSSNKVIFWNDGGIWMAADYDLCREDAAKFEMVCELFRIDPGDDVMDKFLKELQEKDKTTFSFEMS